MKIIYTLAIAGALALVGCSEKKEDGGADAAAAAPAKIVVTQAGNELSPPVAKSAVPDGTWICDMGTVHYVRAEKGDGKCGLCGMDLVLKGGEAAAQAPTAAH